MLQCVHLVKEYYAGDQIIKAVNDLSVTFGDNEFVSILGPSGCGKTTLLNIIGGLDQYTSGDLIINGKSTKEYTDKDWDTYRNHKIGFVFQSYNLIMHQNVLQNVEMALTLSGVPASERKERAKKALEKVGLGDQLDKKPAQMSGGQMQRVAIARALVNDPDIVLADEPTGALDSQTSVQIMEILKEIAKEKLVIMVTHNPELAKAYSTRIITLKDGKITSDSSPVDAEKETPKPDSKKRPSMSFGTALRLSMGNLMTKKGRTLLVSFAGSIGIIGIGLIMSLSNGVQNYISKVESDTMADYPITLEDNTMNMSAVMSAFMDTGRDDKEESEGTEKSEESEDLVSARKMSASVLEAMSETQENNLSVFKRYLESDEGEAFQEAAKAIEYSYDSNMLVFKEEDGKDLVQISPDTLMSELGFSSFGQLSSLMGGSAGSGTDVWTQLPDSTVLRDETYALNYGSWPENENEIVLALDSRGQVTDQTLYLLGLMDRQELIDAYQRVLDGTADSIELSEPPTYTKDEIVGMTFTVLPASAQYEKVGSVWIDQSDDEEFMQAQLEKYGKEVKIVGLIEPQDKTVSSSISSGLYYTSALADWVNEQAENSEIVKAQKADDKINIFTGQSFSSTEKLSMSDLTQEQMAQFASMDQQNLVNYITTYNENANATYDSNLSKLGVVEKDYPSSISLYAASFDDKQKLADLISDYNALQQAKGKEENVLSYTDTIGTMLSGVQEIINLISYVLMGFVSVSLIVSSIMIGIITYISVLERIKEIGILRALGASKKDIRNVFNAETFIIGLASGILGIAITVLLDWPISLIVQNLTGAAGIASMPWQGALVLIVLNLALTTIAGLIPASMASRKNPVEALRSE
jgi:putative ABC transport system permease protein